MFSINEFITYYSLLGLLLAIIFYFMFVPVAMGVNWIKEQFSSTSNKRL